LQPEPQLVGPLPDRLPAASSCGWEEGFVIRIGAAAEAKVENGGDLEKGKGDSPKMARETVVGERGGVRGRVGFGRSRCCSPSLPLLSLSPPLLGFPFPSLPVLL